MSGWVAASIADAPALASRDAAQRERELGFWLYLMSDAVIFALLFATYAIMQPNAAGGPDAKSLFSLSRTLIETLLLLASSYTFGLAGWCAGRADRRAVLAWLGVTAALGLAFLVIEMQEFASLAGRGAGPGRSGFLSAFFTLVGTHGAHVAVGLVWILVVSAQIAVRGLTAAVQSRLSRLGMFWHFLDLVWIGIFSVVYLAGVL